MRVKLAGMAIDTNLIFPWQPLKQELDSYGFEVGLFLANTRYAVSSQREQ